MTNPLEMTDEEFAKLTSPEALEEAEEAEKKAEEDSNEEEKESTQEENTEDNQEETSEDHAEESTDEDKESKSEDSSKEESKDESEPEGKKEVFDSGSVDTNNKKEEVSSKEDKKEDTIQDNKTDNKKIDYQAFYEKVMAPLKANGKTIQLRTPEEAIQLMQMGANYTKKMQAIAPYRKVITMLESNNLLDEDKLSFLIDIDKKNPEAIKKLIKDANIDPLEIDVSTESKYQAGTHRVTDSEVNFRTILDDIQNSEGGIDTIKTINTTWDAQSKNILWEQPEIMRFIYQQQQSGVYKLITDELERRKTLGQIPSGMPFLQAYKLVGDSLLQERQKQAQQQQKEPAPAQQPIATRVMQSKPTVNNTNKVKSASLPRTTPPAKKKFINPLAMSDEDFLKQMANRL